MKLTVNMKVEAMNGTILKIMTDPGKSLMRLKLNLMKRWVNGDV